MRTPTIMIHCAAAMVANGICAQTDERTLAAPTEALVFKSGQSYLYRSVELKSGTTATRLRLPAAIHGTVWLGSDDVALERAVARRATTTETKPVTDMIGVLRRAIGYEVRLALQLGQSQELQHVSGRLARLINAPLALAQQTYWAGQVQPPAATTDAGTPTLVVMELADTTATYPVGSVVSIQHSDPELGRARWDYSREMEVSVLDVAHAPIPANATGGRLGMAAMSDGLAWTPSYTLELGAEGNARLVGKAVLVNDAEPLVATRTRLVVGYPNLKFAGVGSSLRPEVKLDFFRQMLGSADGRTQSTGVMSQVMSNVAGPGGWAGAAPAGPGQPTPGEAAEDLYLYDIGEVTLDRGERMYVPLLESKISFKHRYDWDLPDRVDRNARFIVSPGEEQPTPVWHVLTLDNGGDAPWTTGPVLIQGEQGPLAQSILRYTPTSSHTKVTLTKALNLVGQSFESRVDGSKSPRSENVFFGNRYETVEVQGRIELSNRSGKPAPVRIQKNFSGDLVSAEQEPVTRGNAKGLGRVNASRTLTWTFDLAPGQTWRAEYRYRVLIRR